MTHRLWVARGSTSVTFTPKAFDLVHSISGGVPRMINLLCDRALMVGCEKQTSRITEEHVVHAAGQARAGNPEGQDQGRATRHDDAGGGIAVAPVIAIGARSRSWSRSSARGRDLVRAAIRSTLFGGRLRRRPRRDSSAQLPASLTALPAPADMPVRAAGSAAASPIRFRS